MCVRVYDVNFVLSLETDDLRFRHQRIIYDSYMVTSYVIICTSYSVKDVFNSFTGRLFVFFSLSLSLSPRRAYKSRIQLFSSKNVFFQTLCKNLLFVEKQYSPLKIAYTHTIIRSNASRLVPKKGENNLIYLLEFLEQRGCIRYKRKLDFPSDKILVQNVPYNYRMYRVYVPETENEWPVVFYRLN